jgi:hypothetical protein
MKKEKYGIEHLKEVVDAIALGIKFFNGKMSMWQRVIMKFGGAKKLIAKLQQIYFDRKLIENEMSELSIGEIKNLNIYAGKQGLDKKFTEAFDDILKGVELILSGIGKLK